MHVMVDLETLDTVSSTIVLSIGAVKFDTQVRDEFYMVLDIEAQMKKGRTISASTLLWWLKQDHSTRLEALEKPTSPEAALHHFIGWMEEPEGIWGNGSDFDNAILGHISQSYGLRWPYPLNRCYRTMRNLFPAPEPVKTNAHNALADARWQAEHLTRIMATLEEQ
jgi:hypothetical protein